MPTRLTKMDSSMPIIRIPCKNDTPPSLPLSVSTHGLPSKRIRTRARFALSVSENYLSKNLIDRLGLFPYGKLENGKDFYYIDLHFVVGMLGAVTDHYTFRGIIAMPSSRLTGLIIGMDLIRRGQLTANADGIIFCI